MSAIYCGAQILGSYMTNFDELIVQLFGVYTSFYRQHKASPTAARLTEQQSEWTFCTIYQHPAVWAMPTVWTAAVAPPLLLTSGQIRDAISIV